MKRFLKRIHRNNKGFTLVELLIVIALLAILAAIILPNFTGLTGHGQTEAALAEKITIQTAVDAMMAKEGTSTIASPASTATGDMAAFPSTNTSSQQLFPSFMRIQTAKGTYTCNASGYITQASTGY